MKTRNRTARATLFMVLISLATQAAISSPAIAQQSGSSRHIPPTASTSIPVYDTAWQIFALGTPAQADEYFAELKAQGFTGAWAAVISHGPSTYNSPYRNGELIGSLTNGEIVLSNGYINHVNAILDKAHVHGMKVGLLVAWQNLFLPGGQADENIAKADEVRGTLTTANADAYGRQMVGAFGSHPAVSSWVFGGDSGSNNTVANIAVWDIMADAIKDEGSTLDIGIHLPPFYANPLIYADVDFLDFAAPEIGHTKTPERAQWEMEQFVAGYDIPIWMGEARYYNSDYQWVPEELRNPGPAEVAADAQAAKNAGVSGYLYGDSGRWNWCSGFSDTTPCDRANVAESFGPGEPAVLSVFTGQPSPTTTVQPTTTTTALPAPAPANVLCDGQIATLVGTPGNDSLVGTNGPDVIAGLQGNDTIEGLGGDDVVCGGRGNDVIVGGPGFDTLFGAQGNDVIFSAGGNGETSAQILDDSRGARIFAGAGDDVVVGSNRWDRMQGGPGNDHLLGYEGNDWMRGGPGADTVVGHLGNDNISGGVGNDWIHADFSDGNVRAGAGNDTCTRSAKSGQWRGCKQLVDSSPVNPQLRWGFAPAG